MRRDHLARWDAVELAYVVHSQSRGGYLTKAGTWSNVLGPDTYHAAESRDLELPEDVPDAKSVGPYWLDQWGNVAECQL
jgi:hypothetical protein